MRFAAALPDGGLTDEVHVAHSAHSA